MTDPAARARFEFLVEIYLGSVLGWVDITADVQGQVAITRGLSSESNRANPGTCSMRLDNRSGDYSPRNPAGQWYGSLGRNTPLRVSAGLAGGTLYERFYGEVSEWPARWSLDEVDRYTDVTASGILRRLGQGEQPSWSAMRRTIEASDPVGYWPLEDGTESGQGGSALAGVAAAQISGASEFAAVEDTPFGVATTTIRYGTSALLNLAGGGRVTAQLPASATASTVSAWAVSVAAAVDYSKVSGDVVISEVSTPGGTYVKWQLIHRTSTLRMQVVATDTSGSTTTVIDSAGVYSTLDTYDFGVWQSGGNINAGLGWYLGSYGITGSVAGTLKGVATVTLNATGATQTSDMPFGHLAVWAAQHTPAEEGLTDSYGAFVFGSTSSWRNETAVDRMVRLCDEEGIDLDVTAPSSLFVTRMGWQAPGKFADLLDQCVNADGGYLFEQRTALGLAYRTREGLYNQTPVEIAYSGQLSPPFDPVDDDAQVVNDVTVKRTEGSSARYLQTTGPLAAATPPDGVGVYRTEVELNLYDDLPLLDQAAWRVHLGTVDRPRYPALSVQLAAPGWDADPSGLVALLGVDTGDVLEVTGLPSWAAGDARTLVTGYSETFDEWTWSITFAGVPAQPWDVAEADGDARAGCDGGTLAASVTASSTSLSLATTAANGLWTTAAADFPLDLRVGEEQVTVSAISGSSSPQTATVSARAVNGVSAAWPAGTEVDVWLPAVAAL